MEIVESSCDIGAGSVLLLLGEHVSNPCRVILSFNVIRVLILTAADVGHARGVVTSAVAQRRRRVLARGNEVLVAFGNQVGRGDGGNGYEFGSIISPGVCAH